MTTDSAWRLLGWLPRDWPAWINLANSGFSWVSIHDGSDRLVDAPPEVVGGSCSALRPRISGPTADDRRLRQPRNRVVDALWLEQFRARATEDCRSSNRRLRSGRRMAAEGKCNAADDRFSRGPLVLHGNVLR